MCLIHAFKYMLLCCCITFVLSVPMADALKEGPSLLLVLKWGGELTPAGRVQAEELGRAFRCMYPGGQGITLCLRQPESFTNKQDKNTIDTNTILKIKSHLTVRKPLGLIYICI